MGAVSGTLFAEGALVPVSVCVCVCVCVCDSAVFVDKCTVDTRRECRHSAVQCVVFATAPVGPINSTDAAAPLPSSGAPAGPSAATFEKYER